MLGLNKTENTFSPTLAEKQLRINHCCARQGNEEPCGTMRGKVEQSCAMLQQPKRQASDKRREEEAKLKSRASWQAAG